jgi:NAD(P)-dependent dehydrogenase (short-subunit alcohol dehydrogenase family)
VAVVTGGNSGIGLATAKRFQQEGAKVAISGRNKKTLDEAVSAIGNGVVAIQADVAKLADLDKLYGEETTVTKLPQPTANQKQILGALGVSLPAM